MKPRMTIAAIATAVGLFAVTAVAQHEGHQAPASPPAQTADAGKMDMKSCEMMKSETEVAKLAGQLTQSFAAIQEENDPAKLKERLAEHGLLLKELGAKVEAQSKQMETMKGKMGKGDK